MTLFDAPERPDRVDARRAGQRDRDRAAPSGPLCRVALGLAYDGAGFHGFAAQPGQRTVAGVLADALGRITGHEVALTCAGRTDAGVHARAQVVHADLDAAALARRLGSSLEPGTELPGLARSLSRQGGPELLVWRAVVAEPGFDARRSATGRRYRYLIDATARPDPVLRHSVWLVGAPLELAPMRLAADPLIGEHDFAGFCRRPPDRPSGPLTRIVHDARLVELGAGRYRFEIEAQAFCQQMVRSIVGSLVAIGTGQAYPSDIFARLRSGSRDGAPPLAPACGLSLVAVRYPEVLGGSWS